MTRYAVRNSVVALAMLSAFGCNSGGTMPWMGGGSEGALEAFSGTVQQELTAGRYTYFQLQTPSAGERWVVVADRSQRGAERMAVESCRARRDFSSRRLNRTFSVLYFCSPSKPPSS